MKRAELTAMKNLELKALLAKAAAIKKELIEVKLQSEVKDTKSAFKKRKDLARLLTILRQIQLLEELKKEVV